MGVNEINDQRETLTTQRLENLRKVQRREGEDGGGGGREFQQLLDYGEKEEKEGRKDNIPDKDQAGKAATQPRAVGRNDQPVNKRDKLSPGALIDVEG